ncbi:hypothetical protein [Sediminibacterium goheungense]|uniref:Uncharacterized protein n=1 Tax=Sediminibacterium goheungense TaxID=1086393 RepID=A0A4R6IV43_9BACT|nr:hypothetical protein [Sediminibacterium goheungense]TDO25745.1 hypothetical protein BC659_2668 [Sediminibacterium goheungense]
MKRNLNFIIVCVLVVFAIAVSAFAESGKKQDILASSDISGYPKVQLKAFSQKRTILEAENEANEWLKQNPKFKIISVTFTATPEPEKFYTANNYPGFKYDLVITYSK